MTEKKGGSMMRDPEKEYENAMDVMMEMKARDEDMTTEEAADVLRNAAWLGTDADRERIEEAVEMAIDALRAQPETHEERTETHACDLISRQAAIDALKEHRALFCDNTPDTFSKLSYAEKSRVDELDMAIATLINMPSAQPEIVRCKDCNHWSRESICDGFCSEDCMRHDEDFYCGYAERRTDGV